MSIPVVLAAFITIWLAVLTWILFRHIRRPPAIPLQSVSDFHLGLVKFNPFSDTGGDQSFVLSLLDSQKNGILLTSLHSRGITRIYAKNIILGKADQELSVEEKQALQQSLNR